MKRKARGSWLAAVLLGLLTIFAAPLPATAMAPEKPMLQENYLGERVPSKPVLRWSVIPEAVMYEVEFSEYLPETANGTEPSASRLYATRQVYSNAYQADLSAWTGSVVYWRVRALDFHGRPMGVFSDAGSIYVDGALPQVIKPLPAVTFNENGRPTPLYPVYAWTRIPGAEQYEVEVTRQLPENPNDSEPSRYRIWHTVLGNSFDCYDDEARRQPGTYYWRVRGLDADGRPVGVYSDAQPYQVNAESGVYSASFGDSIVHGGGTVSYSPADWGYSFQTYLSFPNLNLGHSGDTTEALLARFDRDVLPFRPQYLLILGGTNSLRGGVPAEQVIKELHAIGRKCEQNGIRPIFLTLPSINPAAIREVFGQETAANWRAGFTAVNQFIRRQPYHIDLEPHFVDAKGVLQYRYAVDGLHPGLEGKKLMAQIINTHWADVTRPARVDKSEKRVDNNDNLYYNDSKSN